MILGEAIFFLTKFVESRKMKSVEIFVTKCADKLEILSNNENNMCIL